MPGRGFLAGPGLSPRRPLSASQPLPLSPPSGDFAAAPAPRAHHRVGHFARGLARQGGLRGTLCLVVGLGLLGYSAAVLAQGAAPPTFWAAGMVGLAAAALFLALGSLLCGRRPLRPHTAAWRTQAAAVAVWGFAVLVGGLFVGARSLAGWRAAETAAGRAGLGLAFGAAGLSLGVGLEAFVALLKDSVTQLERTSDGSPLLGYVRLLCCGEALLRFACLLPFLAVCGISAAEAVRVWDEECGAVAIHEFVVGAVVILGSMTLAFALALFWPRHLRACSTRARLQCTCVATLALAATALGWAIAGAAWLAHDGDGDCRREHPQLWTVALVDKVLLFAAGLPTLLCTACCKTEQCLYRDDEEVYEVSMATVERAKHLPR